MFSSIWQRLQGAGAATPSVREGQMLVVPEEAAVPSTRGRSDIHQPTYPTLCFQCLTPSNFRGAARGHGGGPTQVTRMSRGGGAVQDNSSGNSCNSNDNDNGKSNNNNNNSNDYEANVAMLSRGQLPHRVLKALLSKKESTTR